MNKKTKKGFTIVELVIVIAVIAILAAVLIPTFSGVIEKAKVSNDVALVKNINTVLATEEIGNAKPATMTDALAMAQKGGYTVEKLTPRSTGELLWNSKTNRFMLVKGDEVVFGDKAGAADVDIWQIASSLPNPAKYSIYAKSDWADPTVDDLKEGFDAGEAYITSITYVGTGTPQSVVIRTNGGTLTVNAPLDTVSHYSVINSVEITEVAPTDCYHEYGIVKGNLNLAKGKVILENGSNTGFVNVKAASAEDISIDIKSGADYGRITAENEALLSAVEERITSSDDIKTLVAAEGTVAIVNNVAYSTFDAAKAAFIGEGAVFELFGDIVNNDMNNQKAISVPAHGTFDGHGYQFNGNVAIYVNAAGGTVKNVSFYMIANNAAVDEETKEYYQMDKSRGKLTAIYANSLSGKLIIENCIFDSIDWDAIQITPVAGAEIVIRNNVFKTSNTVVNQQMRFIHVESSPRTDFAISVKNCDFYDLSKLKETGLEIYYPTNSAKMEFSGNYYDGLDTSRTYTNNDCKQGGTLFSGHLACVGTGSSYINACYRVLDNVASTPNNK